MNRIDIQDTWITLLGSASLTLLIYSVAKMAGWIEVLNWAEVIGVLFNFACVFLVARQVMSTWIFGIIAVIALGFFFYQLQLWGSFALHVAFFLPIQFYGWWVWSRGGSGEAGRLPVSNINPIWPIALLFPSTAFVFGLNIAFDGVSPIWDTMIFGVSVAAQILLTYKKAEHWYLWIAVNVIAIGVYSTAGAPLLAIQYALFLINAIYGVFMWREAKRVDAFWLQWNYDRDQKKQRGITINID